MGSSPSSTPSASIALTGVPVRTSTPSFSSCRRAFSDSESGNVDSTRGPASSSSTRASRGSMLRNRSEEHTSELQSLMRISYAVFCLKKKTYKTYHIDMHELIRDSKRKQHMTH